MFKQSVIDVVKQYVDLSNQEIKDLIEIPPDPELGDYALPCFELSKIRKDSPENIAEDLSNEIQVEKPIGRVENKGPYLNFFIDEESRAINVVERTNAELLEKEESSKKILIEYPSPNTNKPLHLGHVRNMVLGSSVANILEAKGHDVVEVNLNNDRGIHICKSMLAYEKWGDGAEPDKKSDHFVGDFYVKFAKKAEKNPELKEEAQEMLRKWEKDDEEVKRLWKKMNEWALKGFRETYENYNISFDKEYFESDVYKQGKIFIQNNKDKFKVDDNGALIAPLERKYGIQDKAVLRGDGTSIYATQDVGLTLQKIKDFNPDKQIWVVAREQNLYFKQLFAILDMLDIGDKEDYYHLSYGMVNLPSGRMKSREGKVVDADDLLEEMKNLAREEIEKRRDEWEEEKVEKVKDEVALAALRFFIAKYDPKKDFTFNPEESISFEGDTGPYLQYTHARICSILEKADKDFEDADVSNLTSEKEQSLLREMQSFPASIDSAAERLSPHTICNKLLELSQSFNTFYHSCPVLNSDKEKERLKLIAAVKEMLSTGLELLGIEAPEEM